MRKRSSTVGLPLVSSRAAALEIVRVLVLDAKRLYTV